MGYVALMLSNYLHDLAVALLASNVVVIHLAGRLLADDLARRELVCRLTVRLARVTWWVLGFVLAAGAVRAWFFLDFEWNPLVERTGMMWALGMKHVILVGLTVFGIMGMLRCRKACDTDDE